MSRREGLVKKFASMSESFSLRDLTKRRSTLSSQGDNSMHSINMNNSMHSLGNTSHRLRRAALAYGPSTRGSGGGDARTSVKSIMKVHSLEDSLRISEEKNKNKRSIRLNVLAPPALRRGSTAADKVTNLLHSIIHPGHHRDASGKTDLCDSDDEGENELTKSTHDSNHVSFSSVHIRNFKSEVSDNPGVSSGPATGIGWEYTEAPAVDFEEWEAKRGPRLQMKEMVLSRSEREARLRAQGVTTAELAKITKSIAVAKKKRKRTLETMSKHHRLEEALENMSLRMKKLVGARKNDEDEEDELWTEANKGMRRSSSMEFVSNTYNPYVGGGSGSGKKFEGDAPHSPPASSSLGRLTPSKTLPSLKTSGRKKSVGEVQESPSHSRQNSGSSDSRAADAAAGPAGDIRAMQDTSPNADSNGTCKRAIEPKAEISGFGDQDFADF